MVEFQCRLCVLRASLLQIDTCSLSEAEPGLRLRLQPGYIIVLFFCLSFSMMVVLAYNLTAPSV